MDKESSLPGDSLVVHTSAYPSLYMGGVLTTGGVKPGKYQHEPQEMDHSGKWSDCVHDVQKKGEDVDPYAVCTTSVGHQSASPLSLMHQGGALLPKEHETSEADSGSGFSAQLRGKKKK